jgi:hypothetical protein
MQRSLVLFMAAIAGAAFLYMVKLMHDMTGHMAEMSGQVAAMSADMGRMRGQIEVMVDKIGGIERSVEHMEGLAADVHGMRENVAAMTGVVHEGSEQIQRLNPMQMMDRMMRRGGMGNPAGSQR